MRIIEKPSLIIENTNSIKLLASLVFEDLHKLFIVSRYSKLGNERISTVAHGAKDNALHRICDRGEHQPQEDQQQDEVTENNFLSKRTHIKTLFKSG